MRRRLPGVNLSFFIKPETLDAISKALGTVLIGGNEEEEEEREGGESDESIEEVVDWRHNGLYHHMTHCHMTHCHMLITIRVHTA